ncbi:phenylalanine--tRNA ligase subunit alpha [Candidatus Roizmanbacteria bacterium]|nr:phenylalanine--tRNA ligase subunit alpha [Candidatus Roizmanbacteria bacterium]
MNTVDELLTSFHNELKKIQSLHDYEQLYTIYLGRNGRMNEHMKRLKDLSPEKRKEYGSRLNETKKIIGQKLLVKKNQILHTQESDQFVDITLPGLSYPKGSLHMVTYAIEEISRIFERIGFIRMSYPEVEWEWFSFESLNMPSDHPARDDFETFFVQFPQHEKYGKMVLTPHTSSGQIREMMRLGQPPVRMINIAKCYRPNWDATHVPMFHQFEGLCIDKEINITHLKGTIDYFAKEFFGEKRETRLRPFHFQFTEPSFEVDITCDVCGGTGIMNDAKCKVCKSGWLELGGAGMVHPNVLKSGNMDPEKYTGWAFGIGVERTFMMKEGLKLDDIRILYNGDIRFLEQF